MLAISHSTPNSPFFNVLSQKLVQQSSSDQPTADSGIEKPPKPYRSMLQGLKVEKEGEEEEEEEEKAATEEPSIPTPRKRLTNFKIPLLNRGGQRRDQNLSIVSRRRLFSEEGESAFHLQGYERHRNIFLDHIMVL